MPNPVKLHVIEPNGPDKYHICEEVDEQVRDAPVSEHGVGHRNADEKQRGAGKFSDKGAVPFISHQSRFADQPGRDDVDRECHERKPRDAEQFQQLRVSEF